MKPPPDAVGVRELMSPAELKRAVDKLGEDWSRFVVVPLAGDLAMTAGRLAEAHALSGADAVHLASFEELLSRCDDEGVRFSCADAQLRRAARSLQL